nr:LacI family DNA-binding transcriptional regulator [Listeria monocytogenes]
MCKRWYNKEDYEWRRLEMATLADVAKRANVSKMTVSRVINHPD